MRQQVLPRIHRKLPARWLAKRSQRQSAQLRSGVSEAGVWAGQPLSTEISFQGPTSLCRGEGNTTEGAIAMPSEALAVSQVLSMPRSFTRGNREILEASGGPTPSGRVEQGWVKVVCLVFHFLQQWPEEHFWFDPARPTMEWLMDHGIGGDWTHRVHLRHDKSQSNGEMPPK